MLTSELQNVSPMRSALKWGLILGLAEIISHLIFYLLGKPITGITTFIYIILLIGFFIVGILNYRDKELGGFISWKKGFILSCLIGLFGAFVYATYYIVIVTLDRQSFVDASIETLTQGIEKIKHYITDEEALAKMEDGVTEGIEKIKSMSPFQFGLNQFAKSLIAIVLLALIVPAFMKKKNPEEFV